MVSSSTKRDPLKAVQHSCDSLEWIPLSTRRYFFKGKGSNLLQTVGYPV